MVVFENEKKQYIFIMHNHRFSVMYAKHYYDLVRIDMSNQTDVEFMTGFEVDEKDWQKNCEELGIVRKEAFTIILEA